MNVCVYRIREYTIKAFPFTIHVYMTSILYVCKINELCITPNKVYIHRTMKLLLTIERNLCQYTIVCFV